MSIGDRVPRSTIVRWEEFMPVNALDTVARTLAAVLASMLVVAPVGTASAQPVPGIVNMPNLQLPDWDVDEQEQSTIQKREILKAYKKGVEDLQEGHCRSAVNKFEFVLDFIENDPTVYYAAATAARCVRSFRSATGFYESTIEFDPERWEAYRYLGVSYLALGDVEAASDALAELDLARIECEKSCAPDLESAYASLRKAVETAQNIVAPQ